MTGKMKLRNCVVLLSALRSNGTSEESCSAIKANDKNFPLNKIYNLRVRGKVDNDKKLFKHNSKNDLKKLSNEKYLNDMNTENCAKGSAVEGKENKMKKRSNRKFKRLNYSQDTKNKITGILNANKKSSGKECITRKKNIKDKKVNDTVPLREILNDNPKAESDLKNVSLNKIIAVSENIVKHDTVLPVWRKKLNGKRPSCGTKRKSFVDVYDISQDEDILSSEIKCKKQKINAQKNMKKCVNKSKGCFVSNKNVKFSRKYASNTKPVQNRLIKLKVNHQTDTVGSNSEMKVNNIHFSSNRKLDIIQTFVDETRKNCSCTTPADVDLNITPEHIDSSDPRKANNINFSSSSKSNTIKTSVVDENRQNCVCSTPVESDINITSEHIDNDDVSIEQNLEKRSQDDTRNFLIDFADELEKSQLIPRMTSTPHSTLLIKPGIKPLQVSKVTVLGSSHVISKDRKCLKLPFKICDSLPRNNADITLFESPVKKPQKKEPVKSRSPRKNIHINLFKDFNQLSGADGLDDSVLKPHKAYHSPDNFKTHLARTKRLSEVMNKKTKKSKDDIMMEKMQMHFDEISGTELCIE